MCNVKVKDNLEVMSVMHRHKRVASRASCRGTKYES